MVILTERLDTIAKNINKGERVADIGTDHGYLPLYLIENNLSDQVIFTDVSKGSLSKAEENAKRLFPDKSFDFRIGNGLDPIELGEVDTIVMAGIGGILVTEILDWNIKKSLSFGKYILQPRNNSGILRRYLTEHGFVIESNLVVPEDRRFSEIIVTVPPENYTGITVTDNIPDVMFDFPDSLSNKITGYEKDYLKACLSQEETILQKIIAGSGEANIESRQARIDRINALLDCLE